MLQKVLIANRGVIACRILRTLKKMGIRSVAIYSEADRNSPHVHLADEAYCIGASPAAESYLQGEKIIALALKLGVDGIHPGYGFLSENTPFARACTEAGISWIGPSPESMEIFGPKHTARALAISAGVPLLPGTSLLSSLEEALLEAERIQYPIMLKATAGGGGIGMRVAKTPEDLRNAYDTVIALGKNNFRDGGVFLERFIEKARHIEVQIFGTSHGDVVALGERDCSAQRRNQKVLEESPAPHLPDSVRKSMHECAIQLAKACQYRSAGTVEFLYDSASQEFYFLEVNTRLQVEHGVTEEVFDVDLVEWMILEASNELDLSLRKHAAPQGHSIQARIYAEDPYRNFAPSAGKLDLVEFPTDVRIETWIQTNMEISGYYDPMLGKIIVSAPTREEALQKLQVALKSCRIYGIASNLEWLSQIISMDVFQKASHYTQWLNHIDTTSHAMDVLDGGTQTTIQDFPGRIGFWDVGVPPCGPMDDQSFRMGNAMLGNEISAPGLEMTLHGATLRFRSATRICLTGAPMQASLDHIDIPWNQVITIPAGSTLRIGALLDAGMRSYLLIAGGFDIPHYLGSASTFTLGNFGGHGGRALQAGDTIPYFAIPQLETKASIPESIPEFTHHWEIRASAGPHSTSEYIHEEWMEEFFAAKWEVHYQSARTGVRLIGPRPKWSRMDGGEAGLHPSNLHDNAYAIGSVDFTGDMPVILGPDGPSLGGFVCPATVIRSDLWKLGQLKPGDTLQFIQQESETSPILAKQTENLPFPIQIRRAGDSYLLVEYGDLELDLRLRFRAHALQQSLSQQSKFPIIDLTPGIRSLQIHYDPIQVTQKQMVDLIIQCENSLPPLDQVKVKSRIVHLPLSWDDPSTQLAIERYQKNVRPDAPWCPSNIEFIRRINGLQNVDDVYHTLFQASYLVMGLGDVYLGAPVAVPLDPRHRLVTTKYNPARTWTPENAVGIGGAYLCIYGMEGPGGYQFVGRTIQMWNRNIGYQALDHHKPWLLRFFDQIRFYPVTSEKLEELRRDLPQGRFQVQIEETEFNLAEYEIWLQTISSEANQCKERQVQSFQAERERWKSQGLAEYIADNPSPSNNTEEECPAHCFYVRSPIPGSTWKILVQDGDSISEGQNILVAESMKMEMPIASSKSGIIRQVLVKEGEALRKGQILFIVEDVSCGQ